MRCIHMQQQSKWVVQMIGGLGTIWGKEYFFAIDECKLIPLLFMGSLKDIGDSIGTK
jgi:hypothetical protein